ncbi:hypothetical protein H6G33_09690 [Calothrix sp. FACHB-1219]|uniref:hypothetical protein n=1 Tax=unclassified Calothrix TaxID=2619626 RepID=UPI00168905A0|nr:MULTISPECIES: hypothetical protein [unclassified Calothrix]MBD2201619.1 hypothetical protein [Calothrix sp. FACHB-168]MBD2217305.1 hypothetical protein [Calothrix sp. FACHB-1219]
MLVVKFVPTFNDNSMLKSAEEVAWQLRGNVVDGEVYVCIDIMLPHIKMYATSKQIVKHLMLQLHLFGVGVQGCPSVDNNFQGDCRESGAFSCIYDQIEDLYRQTEERGLVTLKTFTKMNLAKVKIMEEKFKALHKKEIEVLRFAFLHQVQTRHEEFVRKQRHK